jgi:hypothetical protein
MFIVKCLSDQPLDSAGVMATEKFRCVNSWLRNRLLLLLLSKLAHNPVRVEGESNYHQLPVEIRVDIINRG